MSEKASQHHLDQEFLDRRIRLGIIAGIRMDGFGEPLCVTTDAGSRYRDEQKGIIMALEKKRLAVLASSAMLALSLVACSSGSTETTTVDTPAEEEETVVSTEPAVETRTVYVMTEKSRVMDYLPDLKPETI